MSSVFKGHSRFAAYRLGDLSRQQTHSSIATGRSFAAEQAQRPSESLFCFERILALEGAIYCICKILGNCWLKWCPRSKA